MNVPFLDLKAQYEVIHEEIDRAVQKVIESCAFAGGPFVESFENDFARFCECEYCIGVGSGTEALWLALLALGVGPGDEVVTVPNTFIATAEAISFCGAIPVFVDIEESSYNMDPEKFRTFLEVECSRESSSGIVRNRTSGRRVKAVIPVHLYGRTADMDPILEAARGYGLPVVEDASQAHGAKYKGRLAGSLGDVGCFSFYPGKNLGAYGEAGAVVTHDKTLADRVQILRDHGQTKKYDHSVVGWNSRMDGIQGAVLQVKLQYLAGWNENRRRAASRYTRDLSNLEAVVLPDGNRDTEHVYHVYAVRVKNRRGLMEFLDTKGIGCAIHYPVPIHLQAAYRSLGFEKGDFPAAERCAAREVSLPMFPELTPEQTATVTDAVQSFYAK